MHLNRSCVCTSINNWQQRILVRSSEAVCWMSLWWNQRVSSSLNPSSECVCVCGLNMSEWGSRRESENWKGNSMGCVQGRIKLAPSGIFEGRKWVVLKYFGLHYSLCKVPMIYIVKAKNNDDDQCFLLSPGCLLVLLILLTISLPFFEWLQYRIFRIKGFYTIVIFCSNFSILPRFWHYMWLKCIGKKISSANTDYFCQEVNAYKIWSWTSFSDFTIYFWENELLFYVYHRTMIKLEKFSSRHQIDCL